MFAVKTSKGAEVQGVNSMQPYPSDNGHFVFGVLPLEHPCFLCVPKYTRTLEQNCRGHAARRLGFSCHSRLALHAFPFRGRALCYLLVTGY